MTTKLLRVAMPCMAIVLTACGGGGSSGTPPPAVTTYAATATAGTGGSISPSSAMVNAGSTTTFTVTASSGYAISGVTGCGGTLTGNTYTTGAVSANCIVTVSFVAQYAVAATAGTGGGISPSSATVNTGGTTTFTVTPNSGYVLGGVTGCGGTLSRNTYTTGAINADCTVTASFVAQYTVTATAGAGGTISPATATVNAGGTTSFTVTLNSGNGYVISGVTGCGGTLSGNTYTTGMISANCAVTASFSPAFTWISGSNATDASGVYGTQGVAAAANVPGSRDGGATWTDNSGNLWLFGGFEGYANSINPATGNFMSDLWEYSPLSGEWTWVSGPQTPCSPAVYGTQGVASAANVPGPRTATTPWADIVGSDDVWLFGGGGCDSTGTFLWYGDLWKFSRLTNEWTWVGGSTAPNASAVYGNVGVPAATNMPGGRGGFAKWTDASGNLWLFGGSGWDASATSKAYLNDLWEYSSGEWTWMGGSDTFNASGVYGTQGKAAGSNVPGARWAALSWTDAQGNFWLFGGFGRDSTGAQGVLNDLWEYSPSSNQWTWVSGSNTINATGVYGVQGTAAAGNVPSARDLGVAWRDAFDNLWLFGGEAYDTSDHLYHRLNDLWEYSPSSNEWTWVAGSDTFDAPGVYGTEGMAAAGNVPGARAAAVTWQENGMVWIFGGYTYDDQTSTRFEMNDLWRYPTE